MPLNETPPHEKFLRTPLVGNLYMISRATCYVNCRWWAANNNWFYPTILPLSHYVG